MICSFGSEHVFSSTSSLLVLTPSCQEGNEELQRSGLTKENTIRLSDRLSYKVHVFCCGFMVLTVILTSSCVVRAASPSVRASLRSLDTKSSSRQIFSHRKWPINTLTHTSVSLQEADHVFQLAISPAVCALSACMEDPPRARPLAWRLTCCSCCPRQRLSSNIASSIHLASLHQPCRTLSHTYCNAGAAGDRVLHTLLWDHSLRTGKGHRCVKGRKKTRQTALSVY